MKIELEFSSEQMSRLLDAMSATYEDLDNKLKHLKGRVRNLENMQRELIKALEYSRNE